MFRKTKVIIGQLGSPKSVDTKDVRAYLKEFLGDPRVVDINSLLWKIILNLFVLPFRPKKSAEAYSRIYENGKFPLIENTKQFTSAVGEHIDDNLEINHAFLLSSPRVSDVIDEWETEDSSERADRVVVLPQFPQYSESTVASVYDQLGKDLGTRVNIPSVTVISSYHKLKAFIDLGAKKIQNYLDKENPEELLISFHGIPLRRVLQKKDEYYFHCYETFHLLKQKLNYPEDKIHMVFQSRFGSEQWLGPATDEYAIDLVEKGSKKIACYCPSFVVDCLETTDEIGNELREEVEEAGGELIFIECLNDDADWAKDYAHFINVLCNGSQKELDELFYKTDEKELRRSLPEQKQKSPPMEPEAKKNVKLVFLTLFLDLVGFSIIFPMFPALAKFYLENDSNNAILHGFFGQLEAFGSIGQASMSSVALFGGALGALYSLLQFFASPFWGRLSDRIGRRPVMLFSIFGLFLSYVLWIFSGSFTLLLVARVLGGLMAGNLSVATAIVADVTSSENRSKGMAFVGIAFALGFIFGPAIGGLLSMIDLTQINPGLIAYGINPFSVPAAFAAILGLINFVLIFSKYKETLKEKNTTKRTSNPLKLLKPLPYPGVNRANLGYFLFITLFSGMEFTLTFLAVERLAYTPIENAYMFIFIGLVIAFTQGGYVRRKASSVGEKSMAIRGLAMIIPGLLAVSFATNSFILYVGLLFLAIGSAMAIPTLTSLVSLYTPVDSQGEALGVFRSLGSLGRVFGPAFASVMYWKMGSGAPYIVGAILILLPIIVLRKLPEVEKA
ncbi:MAG: ferrochelatase [Halobacteriovoraceae bacterium]|nr:ferrochelatase [Halobacteriovoraceae bacterium]|tara:strand:+ start:36911 stop:39271 length:2361 start_codon:yes stop_codon:yes gene_type:complete